MEFYTNEEMLDKYIGAKGTPERKSFDAEVEAVVRRVRSKTANTK